MSEFFVLFGPVEKTTCSGIHPLDMTEAHRSVTFNALLIVIAGITSINTRIWRWPCGTRRHWLRAPGYLYRADRGLLIGCNITYGFHHSDTITPRIWAQTLITRREKIAVPPRRDGCLVNVWVFGGEWRLFPMMMFISKVNCI